MATLFATKSKEESVRRVELVLAEIVAQIKLTFGANYHSKQLKNLKVTHQRCGKRIYFFLEIQFFSGLSKEFYVPMVVSVTGYKQLRTSRVRYLLSQEIALDLKEKLDKSIESKSYRSW